MKISFNWLRTECSSSFPWIILDAHNFKRILKSQSINSDGMRRLNEAILECATRCYREEKTYFVSFFKAQFPLGEYAYQNDILIQNLGSEKRFGKWIGKKVIVFVIGNIISVIISNCLCRWITFKLIILSVFSPGNVSCRWIQISPKWNKSFKTNIECVQLNSLYHFLTSSFNLI